MGRILSLLLMGCALSSAHSGGPTSLAPPYTITVEDYLQSEPITAAAQYPTQYPAVGSQGAPAVCWPKTSGTRQVRLVFQSPTAVEHEADLTLSDGLFEDADGIVFGLNLTGSPTTLEFAPWGTAETFVTIAGMPNYVTKGTLSFSLTLISDHASLASIRVQTVYLTLNSPQGLQRPAWTNVLDDVCTWAHGQSVASGCSQATTTSMFQLGVFRYQPTQSAAYYTTIANIAQNDEDDSYYCKYKLKKLFNDRSNPNVTVYGDCRDTSNYLWLGWQALGIGGSCTQYRSDLWDAPPHIKFQTNKICPSGSSSSDFGNYTSYAFNFHQVVMAISVYDPSCAQWTTPTGQQYQDAPAGWDLAAYWQTPRQNPPQGESAYYGLVWRYDGSSNPAGEDVGRMSRMSYLVGYSALLN